MIPQMNFTIYGIGLMAVGEGVRVWSLLLEYVEYMGGMLTRGSLAEGMQRAAEGSTETAPAIGSEPSFRIDCHPGMCGAKCRTEFPAW